MGKQQDFKSKGLLESHVGKQVGGTLLKAEVSQMFGWIAQSRRKTHPGVRLRRDLDAGQERLTTDSEGTPSFTSRSS